MTLPQWLIRFYDISLALVKMPITAIGFVGEIWLKNKTVNKTTG